MLMILLHGWELMTNWSWARKEIIVFVCSKISVSQDQTTTATMAMPVIRFYQMAHLFLTHMVFLIQKRPKAVATKLCLYISNLVRLNVLMAQLIKVLWCNWLLNMQMTKRNSHSSVHRLQEWISSRQKLTGLLPYIRQTEYFCYCIL